MLVIRVLEIVFVACIVFALYCLIVMTFAENYWAEIARQGKELEDQHRERVISQLRPKFPKGGRNAMVATQKANRLFGKYNVGHGKNKGQPASSRIKIS